MMKPIRIISIYSILVIYIMLSCQLCYEFAYAESELTDIKLFSHRGFKTKYPENSIESIKFLIKAGVHGVEIDLRTTKDGHIILMHDETLGRTTTGNGLVREKKWTDIQSINLKGSDGSKTSSKVPDLTNVLSVIKKYPSFELALDLKAVDAVTVAKMVVDADVVKQTQFFIADPLNTKLAKSITRLHPDLRITIDMLGWWKIEDVPLFAARALDTNILFASEWFFPKRGFKGLKQEGISVIVYLWGNHKLEKRFQRAAKLGASAVSCDDPLKLLPLVKPLLK
ncbi:MAG: glycerophosphoryl diester phosphodiesterase [Candidatus Magnetoglobus multicellularis str. Araruama]|uniref:Glycerophosphoryl diester phosphodiesterase n=1 Tax=Candidatus Magnetoglobus multicellularis str. Araruama TaxID=890399 RepID=A0A1V1PCI1_9BACT|nr:MAG: glycerophosphoryl diester phosphodiesterase [Candidatus Magnetoglobus multicellularis str. Araruama]